MRLPIALLVVLALAGAARAGMPNPEYYPLDDLDLGSRDVPDVPESPPPEVEEPPETHATNVPILSPDDVRHLAGLPVENGSLPEDENAPAVGAPEPTAVPGPPRTPELAGDMPHVSLAQLLCAPIAPLRSSCPASDSSAAPPARSAHVSPSLLALFELRPLLPEEGPPRPLSVAESDALIERERAERTREGSAVIAPAADLGLEEGAYASQSFLADAFRRAGVYAWIALGAVALASAGPLVRLYRRLARKALLANAHRAAIYEAVRTGDGVTSGGIATRLGIDRRTALHHLSVLEDFSLVRGTRIGGWVRYYPTGGRESAEARRARLIEGHPAAKRILAHAHAGSLGEIARRAGLPKSTVKWHVDRLRGVGGWPPAVPTLIPAATPIESSFSTPKA